MAGRRTPPSPAAMKIEASLNMARWSPAPNTPSFRAGVRELQL
jgi:hypothetical protein